MTACPKCQLPTEEHAWQCDGCGYEFRQDFEAVRLELRTELRKSHAWLVVMGVLSLGMIAGAVYLVLNGRIYVSATLGLAVVGSIVRSTHKISVLRRHLSLLDRRHVPLPKATARLGPGTDGE